MLFLSLHKHAYAEHNHRYSPFLLGALGLNTVPSARMNLAGTISADVSAADPYFNTAVGIQIADPLYIGLRQSAEVSSFKSSADRLSPGLDFKLRLLQENKYQPELSIGAISAFGNQRLASEYLVASKRYHDFDFTLGAAWGRMGSKGHVANPLKALGSHFQTRRNQNDVDQNTPQNWFTGEDIGFFAGVEYFAPINGLSFKADWNADGYDFERAAFGYDAPAPWSASVVYSTPKRISVSLGTLGGDKILGRLSFQSHAKEFGKYGPHTTGAENFKIFSNLYEAITPAVSLNNIKYSGQALSADILLHEDGSAPRQIQSAMRELIKRAKPETRFFEITPYRGTLSMQTYSFSVQGVKNTLYGSTSSSEELWHNSTRKRTTKQQRAAASEHDTRFLKFALELEEHASLSEVDNNIIRRTSLFADFKTQPLLNLVTLGTRIRINPDKNSLRDLNKVRIRPEDATRFDVEDFADMIVSLDRLYTNIQGRLSDDIYASASAGYLEQMYGGVGGEIIYRPYQSRLAFGAEAWWAKKRDPDSEAYSNFLNDTDTITGHINAWYDLPHWDTTLHLEAGRYLAEDYGAGIGLIQNFENGSVFKAHATISKDHDIDVFGGEENVFAGIAYSVPLSAWGLLPKGSKLTFKSEPFGRLNGQSLDTPMPLYDSLTPLSYAHISQNWADINE